MPEGAAHVDGVGVEDGEDAEGAREILEAGLHVFDEGGAGLFAEGRAVEDEERGAGGEFGEGLTEGVDALLGEGAVLASPAEVGGAVAGGEVLGGEAADGGVVLRDEREARVGDDVGDVDDGDAEFEETGFLGAGVGAGDDAVDAVGADEGLEVFDFAEIPTFAEDDVSGGECVVAGAEDDVAEVLEVGVADDLDAGERFFGFCGHGLN